MSTRTLDRTFCDIWSYRREELHQLLASQGEPLHKVARVLAKIQKNSHSERCLTRGFLGAWPVDLHPGAMQVVFGWDEG
jgi:hypothetical protein